MLQLKRRIEEGRGKTNIIASFRRMAGLVSSKCVIPFVARLCTARFLRHLFVKYRHLTYLKVRRRSAGLRKMEINTYTASANRMHLRRAATLSIVRECVCVR